jgi:hypothetical protein
MVRAPNDDDYYCPNIQDVTRAPSASPPGPIKGGPRALLQLAPLYQSSPLPSLAPRRHPKGRRSELPPATRSP